LHDLVLIDAAPKLAQPVDRRRIRIRVLGVAAHRAPSQCSGKAVKATVRSSVKKLRVRRPSRPARRISQQGTRASCDLPGMQMLWADKDLAPPRKRASAASLRVSVG